MKLIVNGVERESEARTLFDLWKAETGHAGDGTPRGFAVALNGRLVPREDWADTAVGEHDHVEIVRAMQGG